MCGSCHLDKALDFEIGIKCQFFYSLFCLLLDQKEGRTPLQFSYRNHPTFFKPWMCPKMCFTAILKDTSITIIQYSTPILTSNSLSKWHDTHLWRISCSFLLTEFWYFCDTSSTLSKSPFVFADFTICTIIGVNSPSRAKKILKVN